MIEYFILQLTTAGFQKNYNDKSNTAENEIKIFSIIFLLTFILFFYFTISFGKFIKNYKELDDYNNEEEKKNKSKDKEIISKLSNEILDGTHAILFFNGLISLIISSIKFSLKTESEKDTFEAHNTYFFIPILMNKFYYFTLNYYCISLSEDEKGFELISGSTLISLYMALWNLILGIIIRYSNDTILYIIQIISSCIPSLILLMIIIISISYCFFCKLLFCCFSYFLLGGVFWYRLEDDICEDNCYFMDTTFYCECCCCDVSSPCFCDCCFEHCFGCEKFCCCKCYDIFRYFKCSDCCNKCICCETCLQCLKRK